MKPINPDTKTQYRTPSNGKSKQANYQRRKYGIGAIRLYDGAEGALKAAGLSDG